MERWRNLVIYLGVQQIPTNQLSKTVPERNLALPTPLGRWSLDWKKKKPSETIDKNQHTLLQLWKDWKKIYGQNNRDFFLET